MKLFPLSLRALLVTLGLMCSVAARADIAASGVKAPENAILTANQRLFVSSTEAVHELKLVNGVWSKTKLPYQFSKATCNFYAGMAEVNGIVYVACSGSVLGLGYIGKAWLVRFDSRQEPPVLTDVGEVPNMKITNGLTADSYGNLYLADEGSIAGVPVFGSIRKITLSADGTTIASQGVFRQYGFDGRPNGLRYHNGHLYVSQSPYGGLLGVGSRLVRYDLAPGGLLNPRTIYTTWLIMDDFALVDGGVVVAEFGANKVTHVSESGMVLHRLSAMAPSSITLLSSPFGAGNLLVTERPIIGTNQVERLQVNWGLKPRS